MKKKRKDANTTRFIKAAYWRNSGRNHEEALRITSSAHERSACMRAFDHMSHDDYGAALCEVWNETSGEQLATLKRTPRRIITWYKRDPKELQ